MSQESVNLVIDLSRYNQADIKAVQHSDILGAFHKAISKIGFQYPKHAITFTAFRDFQIAGDHIKKLLFIFLILFSTFTYKAVAQTSAVAASNPDQSFVLDAPPVVADIPMSLQNDGPKHGKAPDTKSPDGFDEQTIKTLVQIALERSKSKSLYKIIHIIFFT